MEEEKLVAIYTRVSTTDQAREGHSLEEQEKRLRAMCEAKNYKVYKVYTDAGISGKSADNRPAYQQMMKDMKKAGFPVMCPENQQISRIFLQMGKAPIPCRKDSGRERIL